ncbi:MAG: hypothetical protein J0I06_15550 [Planctomycetes bacterium]|nr:hypothetical protein [Planctomycetota bacterium]
MSSPDYVRVTCGECAATLRVGEDQIGERVTCPKCDGEFVARESRRSADRPTARPVRRSDDEDEDERPRARSRRRGEEDDEDERPRRGGRRSRDEDEEDEDDYDRGPRPGCCPSCGSRRSTKVSFTWWGGLVGPAIFSLVQCKRCRQQYNNKSGKPFGAVHIILYSLVVLFICGGILFAISR